MHVFIKLIINYDLLLLPLRPTIVMLLIIDRWTPSVLPGLLSGACPRILPAPFPMPAG